MPKIFIIFILLLTACSAVVEITEENQMKEVLEMLSSIGSYDAHFEMHFISNRGINVYQMVENEDSIRVLAPESLKDSIITLRENDKTFLLNFLDSLNRLPKTVNADGDIITISLTVNISPYIYTQVLTVENKILKSLISYDINNDARMKIFFTSINFGN